MGPRPCPGTTGPGLSAPPLPCEELCEPPEPRLLRASTEPTPRTQRRQDGEAWPWTPRPDSGPDLGSRLHVQLADLEPHLPHLQSGVDGQLPGGEAHEEGPHAASGCPAPQRPSRRMPPITLLPRSAAAVAGGLSHTKTRELQPALSSSSRGRGSAVATGPTQCPAATWDGPTEP